MFLVYLRVESYRNYDIDGLCCHETGFSLHPHECHTTNFMLWQKSYWGNSQGGRFLWDECSFCSVSNVLYSLDEVRDLFVYTISQSQQKNQDISWGLFFFIIFIFPINRCNRFRHAINESETQHYVVLILTVILPPGINLSPAVTDPDNSAELKKTQGSCPCTVTTGIKVKRGREGSDNNGKLFWHPGLSNYWI